MWFNANATLCRFICAACTYTAMCTTLPAIAESFDLSGTSELGSGEITQGSKKITTVAMHWKEGLAFVGDRNTATIQQTGNGNASNLYQSGKGNVADLIQRGSYNEIELNQNGNGNLAKVIEIGTRNKVEVTQVGVRDQVLVQQFGFKQQFAVQQHGNGLTAKVIMH